MAVPNSRKVLSAADPTALAIWGIFSFSVYLFLDCFHTIDFVHVLLLLQCFKGPPQLPSYPTLFSSHFLPLSQKKKKNHHQE